ncbi:hypothetical protein D3C87_1700920 [compost metagenome]
MGAGRGKPGRGDKDKGQDRAMRHVQSYSRMLQCADAARQTWRQCARAVGAFKMMLKVYSVG